MQIKVGCFKGMEKTYRKSLAHFSMSSTEPLREIVQKLADTFNNPQKREISYFDFYDDSLIIHGFPPTLPSSKEDFRQFIHLLWKAFPNIKITFDDVIVEGNKVACRYNLTGTHKGEFFDLQPTNKQFKVNGMTLISFRKAKCVERWNLVNMISLLEQLRAQS